MSTNTATGVKPNDSRTDDAQDGETTATARQPLGEEIAEYAPYARNDARNGGGSR